MKENNSGIEIFNEDLFREHVVSQHANLKLTTVQGEGSCFSLLTQHKGIFKYIWNLPFGLYHPEQDKNQLERLLSASAKLRSSQKVINAGPLSGITKLEASGLARKYGYFLQNGRCHVINTQFKIEHIFEGFNSTRKKHIRRYQKAGEVKVFKTKEPIYFSKYFALYEDSAKRWGTKTSYEKKFLEGLHGVPGIYIWVAEKEGEVLSAMICIYSDNTVFDWLAASIINQDVKKLYAAAAVQFEVIKDAAERGLKQVNMGASKDLEGVSDFKDSWGAEEHETYTFVKKSGIFTLLKKIRQLIRK